MSSIRYDNEREDEEVKVENKDEEEKYIRKQDYDAEEGVEGEMKRK
jgi:hypothetical protein